MAKGSKTVKLKTHKGTQKRVKQTKKWKVIFDKIWNNHLLTNKGKNNKAYPYGKELSKTMVKKIKTLSPYK